jgi:hypothetical protein
VASAAISSVGLSAAIESFSPAGAQAERGACRDESRARARVDSAARPTSWGSARRRRRPRARWHGRSPRATRRTARCPSSPPTRACPFPAGRHAVRGRKPDRPSHRTEGRRMGASILVRHRRLFGLGRHGRLVSSLKVPRRCRTASAPFLTRRSPRCAACVRRLRGALRSRSRTRRGRCSAWPPARSSCLPPRTAPGRSQSRSPC